MENLNYVIHLFHSGGYVIEMKDPTRYHDSGMLFRLPNGLAVEPALIRKKFLKWQDAHPEFPRIVFHGLRHSSATYQLMISDGDVKAVQGTTGHASAICW